MKGFIADIEDLTEGNTDFPQLAVSCTRRHPTRSRLCVIERRHPLHGSG
jgi:hypothetical protein